MRTTEIFHIILHHPCIHTHTSFHIFPVLGLTNTAERPGSAYILSLSWCIILNKKNNKGLSRDHSKKIDGPGPKMLYTTNV